MLLRFCDLHEVATAFPDTGCASIVYLVKEWQPRRMWPKDEMHRFLIVRGVMSHWILLPQ